MKMVFIGFLHGFGGAERMLIMLANAMSNRGHEVTLISLCDDNRCYEICRQVHYVFLPDRKKGFLRFISRYRDIKTELLKIRPDVTINFWLQGAYLTAMMVKTISGKTIYSERGDPGDSEYKGLLGLVRKKALQKTDSFVFQSKAAQYYFEDRIQNRSVVIPNPVFINRQNYPQLPTQRKVIVTMGRLHPQKNQRLLIDAFSLIADKFPDYSLEIYGEGVLRNELQSQIDNLQLSERVNLKGVSKQVHELIVSAELFVLSSDYEGMPNALLEAMALGLPCISTDCRPGGAREIITDGVDGIITKVGDKENLADAMTFLLSNQKKRKEFSERALIKIRQFQPSKIYDKWELFFFETAKD